MTCKNYKDKVFTRGLQEKAFCLKKQTHQEILSERTGGHTIDFLRASKGVYNGQYHIAHPG